MNHINLRRSRILERVRLFLFIAVVLPQLTLDLAYAAPARTTEGRLNRNAYPLTKFADRYANVPKGVEVELRARIEQVLVPVRLAPRSWMQTVLGSAPSVGDRRRILDAFSDTEIWKCLGETCRGCPGDEGSGCVLGSKVSGGVGVVMLVHPCLYGEGACGRGVNADIGTWAEKAVATLAFYKAGHVREGSSLTKAQKASANWIRETSASVNRILGACPGPYASESMVFLVKHESVKLPNAAIKKCGETYFKLLEDLPSRCKSLRAAHQGEWEAFRRKFMGKKADIVRVDDYGKAMLCRKKTARTIFTVFAESPTLLIGDNGCEGEKPIATEEFIREALPKPLRAKLDATRCLPEPETRLDSPNTSDLSSGNEVQLVD